MLLLLRKSVMAILASVVFVVTALIGMIAGLLGALIRAQLPDPASIEATSPEPQPNTPQAGPSTSRDALPRTELHRGEAR
jgi:hypothetical protein